MRVFLTGANGYIGSRLLLSLAEAGHHVIACVRSARRLTIPNHLKPNVEIVEADFLKPDTLANLPKEIDVAYYLLHAMGNKAEGFTDDEEAIATNFVSYVETTICKQVIYLGGLVKGKALSEHMQSRERVQKILQQASVPTTVLRAGIIIGAGSASFEILRDLVEKLPVMVTPKWVRSSCQPISVVDVIYYLTHVLLHKGCFDRVFDIGGPEKITYGQMLRRFAKLRCLHRLIIPVPVLTPKLSSYWLFFITATSFPLSRALVESLTSDAVCSEQKIQTIIPHACLGYETALRLAFDRIEQNEVISSWKDAVVGSHLNPNLLSYIDVPKHGCLRNVNQFPYKSRQRVLKTLWEIGGDNGWYFMDWAWVIRGFIDRMAGGAGLRRGRTHPTRLRNGDVIDFWRVLLADQEHGRLLLYAEMKVPGEAWLEVRIEGDEHSGTVTQTATFRPKGIAGRLYWYILLPIHLLIFRGLCKAIATGNACKGAPCSD